MSSSIRPQFNHQNHSFIRLSTQIHHSKLSKHLIQCSAEETKVANLRTCKQCKKQYDPVLNHPQACRFHTAHFGGNYFPNHNSKMLF